MSKGPKEPPLYKQLFDELTRDGYKSMLIAIDTTTKRILSAINMEEKYLPGAIFNFCLNMNSALICDIIANSAQAAKKKLIEDGDVDESRTNIILN